MQATFATAADIPQVYALLGHVGFYLLPAYEDARPILEQTHALIVKDDGKVVLWAAYHGSNEITLDLVISPEWQRRIATKGISKYILAHGLNLSQDGRMVVDCYNPSGIKAALAVGFELAPEDSKQPGWVKLQLTREMFNRKFKMRG